MNKIASEQRIGTFIGLRLFPVLLITAFLAFVIAFSGEKTGVISQENSAVKFFAVYAVFLAGIILVTSQWINKIEREHHDKMESDILKRTEGLLELNQNLNSEIADRIKAEKAAEAESKMFNDVLELLPAYIILLTPDHHVHYANRFFRERFGESHGKRCFEYLFNRTEPCEVCDTFRVLKEDRTVTWEWTGPDKCNYSIFDFPFTLSDGSIMIMEMGIDITSLKVAQSQLEKLNAELEERVSARTSELKLTTERLQILSETSSRLLESGNPQQLINELCYKVMKFLNCEVFFNYLLDEKAGRLHLNSYSGISKKDAKDIEWLDLGVAVCGCVARDGIRIIAEYIDETDDIRTRLVKSYGVKAYACHPLMSGDKVLGTLSFGTKTRQGFTSAEVSMMKTVSNEVAIALSRMNYENALRISGEKLNLALQNGNIGIWEWDIESNRVEWDERMHLIFGFAPGSFDGSYDAFEKCLAEEDVPNVRKAINDSLNNDVPFELVFRINKDNSKSYISSKALVVRADDGSPVKLSGVCFDITDMRKGAEKTLFKLNEDLLRSNRELEQFAYVASHDLQEPLRMVSSYTQMLELRYNDKLDNDARDFIKYAVDGTVRMQNLINDLLGFSRIETNGGKFLSSDFDTCLSRSLNNLKYIITEKKALITHGKLPVLTADENQIVLLFQNLLGNGIKFCKDHPRIHVSAKEENEHFVFSVRDNGIGIEPQYYNKIFRIFQRLVTKEEYEGTGIGLAICKRIVERHEGKIWVESEPGAGSTFFFTIPKKRLNQTSPQQNFSLLS